MPLPESIPVRYTEEEAEYLSVRPLVKQTFRLLELIDMVLGVTGKDVARIQQILRSGTVVYHSYRYWWPAFESNPEELAGVLASFPDADPARVFRAAECTAVILEGEGHPPRRSMELARETAAHKRILRRRSFWDALLALGGERLPAYQKYSYERRADLYELALARQQAAALAAEATRFAPRRLRAQLHWLENTSQIVFVCPRRAN
jgi:hypothetical protein